PEARVLAMDMRCVRHTVPREGQDQVPVLMSTQRGEAMNNLSAGIRPLGVVALASLLATSGAWAQEVTLASQSAGQAAPSRPTGVQPAQQNRESDLHRMEIYNGSVRTVRYFSPGASPGELATLRDMEQAESSLGVMNDLLALSKEYVTNEQA